MSEDFGKFTTTNIYILEGVRHELLFFTVSLFATSTEYTENDSHGTQRGEVRWQLEAKSATL